MQVSKVVNLLARSFLVFIIAWLWISFYVRSFILILLMSTAITLAVEFVLSFVSKRRNHKHIKTKKEREHMKQVILQLKFMTKIQTQALFKKAFPKLNIKSLFHTTPTEYDIIACIKSAKKNSKLIITAEFFPPSVMAFSRSLDVNLVLLDSESVYTQILAPTGNFPEIKIQTKKQSPRKTIREIKTLVFNRTRTKSYVITGVVIMVSSLIIRLHLYYIIIATIVFALALSSYFSPRVPNNLFET